MTQPRTSTVKRLFAVSGNSCAFPGCECPLVDAVSGKVTAKICHIRARSNGGPRFDSDQSDEARHGFDNLVLMCPVHHDVIDHDPDTYTVDRLERIKLDHERKSPAAPDVSNEVAAAALANIESGTVTGGSLMASTNQKGHIAHSMTVFEKVNQVVLSQGDHGPHNDALAPSSYYSIGTSVKLPERRPIEVHRGLFRYVWSPDHDHLLGGTASISRNLESRRAVILEGVLPAQPFPYEWVTPIYPEP